MSHDLSFYATSTAIIKIFFPFTLFNFNKKNCNSSTKGTKKNRQGDTFMVNIINNPNMYRMKKFEKQY